MMNTEGRQEEPVVAGEGTLTAAAETLAREHARDVAKEPRLSDHELTVLQSIQTEATDLDAQFEAEEALGRALSVDERHQIVQARHAADQEGRRDGGEDQERAAVAPDAGTCDDAPPHGATATMTGTLPGESVARRGPERTGERGPAPPSFHAVLRHRGFRALWLAQICSQLAQNLTWLALGAYVAHIALAGKNTAVAAVTISAMVAQLFLSGFAGVIVDRASKRRVLTRSNIIRVGLTLLLIPVTWLDAGLQPRLIILLIFLINAVAQFFTPAEAATIPLLVDRRHLLAATALFNITLNACQVIPIMLGLVVLELIGIVPLLLVIAAFYGVAAFLVSTLPRDPAPPRGHPVAASLPLALRHIGGDLGEALRFLARDPGLRLTLFQINVAPTFLFIFGTLGLNFVSETFGLTQAGAWRLLLPAGLGLIVGALVMGRIAAGRRKEGLINLGLLVMGGAVTLLGAVAVVAIALYHGASTVGAFVARHIHRLPPLQAHNIALIPPAMVLAFIIGLAMALATIPAQTLVLERTAENVRGRVLALQQLVGGAVPIIPLLVAAPLADAYGNAAVMTGLGLVIVLVGALSVRLDHAHRRRARRTVR